MQQDLMQRLQQLQQRTTQLGQLAAELASAVPECSEGCDASGRVLVVLGRDGVPAEIRVRDRWQERLEPDQLGAAVLDAAADAGQSAIRALTGRLDESRWWRRQRDADEGTIQDEEPLVRPPLGRPQHDGEFNEQVMNALHASVREAGQPHTALEATGTDSGQHVAVTLTGGGIVGCFVDPWWARDRTGSAITESVSAALRRARRDLATPAHPSAQLDTLVGDALATLNAVVHQRAGGDE
ncbi:hypothetical protein AMIS_3440 [Actinoplanes missouriensis 431]|uniref:YbaB/EbfC DNA-binding family protein n=1 Tax=Actinoplanes missouriensis (strain ATCC 14538 / DSM 43046 / CBS 188.64 / JCM 3121 / NBRC 102363 / NCIMB 12654 / NRRL B-3342 / UNCC 431) TaxID=512565 RepID=I0GXS7_ACTM4|nr:hypothetical protein [Actinoplanes missouriensis]BAL85564.1 hypothetical protein AMIS_3440 [Actinoplanes missouriensis 431]